MFFLNVTHELVSDWFLFHLFHLVKPQGQIGAALGHTIST